MDLVKQSGESLRGRISYLELGPFGALEIDPPAIESLWVRGGFPRSFLASSDDIRLQWRRDFVRTYLERDIVQFGPRIPAETLRRFWTMLSHNQAQPLNAANLARSLAVDGKTVAGYLELLVDLLLVRRFPAWHRNAGKRLVKAPKVYVRDSGIALALLGNRDKEALLSHPVVGQTWERFVDVDFCRCSRNRRRTITELLMEPRWIFSSHFPAASCGQSRPSGVPRRRSSGDFIPPARI